MTDRELRGALAEIADEVTTVDLGPRVRARAQVLRRRRRAAVVAAPVVGLLVAAGFLAAPTGTGAAPPAGPRRAPTVELSDAARGPLGSTAVLGILDPGSSSTWLVDRRGRAATVTGTGVSSLRTPPVLSGGGSVLSLGGPGTVRAVSGIDGTVTRVQGPDRDHLVSVSPDGRIAAFAVDDRVDSLHLTLVPLDGGTATTVLVTTSRAAGELVPVVWNDDGSAVLVLEGLGATRVDLSGARPRPERGVYVKDDLVLAYGWAAAPDLSRFAMGAAQALGGGQRQWQVLDARTGAVVDVVTRPMDDRLIGWIDDNRLVWWRPTGDGYTVLSTDTAGRSPRRELRVESDRPHLVGSWTED